MWKKQIKRGEKVELELTRAERKLLLTGLVFLHRGVEEAVRSTPPGEPVMITLGDLEDMAGHVAGEANHAKTERTEELLSDIYEKIEELLDTYAEESGPAKGGSATTAESSADHRMDEKPTILPIPFRPKSGGEQYPVKLTKLQREAMIAATRLRRGIKNKIGEVPDGTQTVRFTRKEIVETAGEVNTAIDFAPNPYRKRLVAVRDKIEGVLNGLDDVKERPVRTPGKTSGGIYQFKITLKDTKPPVWRRIEVPDCPLGDLHEVIQIVMGWQNSHLHQFVVNGEYYGPLAPDDFGFGTEMGVGDEEGILLSEIIKGDGKVRFVYEYDFGDGWRHEVLFEKTVEADLKATYPRCVEGARACPPEDCGGPGGYADFLAAIADPKHENPRDMKGWFGGKFDPETFSAEAVNRRLKGMLR